MSKAAASSRGSRLARRAAVVALRTAWPLTALQIARGLHAQWQTNLSVRQRRQLLALVRKSHGRPSRLNSRDRRRLRAIASSYDVPQLARRALLPAPGKRGAWRLLRRNR